MLVDNPDVLRNIFSNTKLPISVHCEDEEIIRQNMATFKEKYGEDIPMFCHPLIRSEEVCYQSSSKAIALAKKLAQDCTYFTCQHQKKRIYLKTPL